MEKLSRPTWSAIAQRGLLLLAAALPIVSIFVPWVYHYWPLHNPQDPSDPTTITYIVPWDRWTGFLDLWQHRDSYSGDPMWISVAIYFGPPLLLAILAVWNLVRGRRSSTALRWALVITGILGLLWTGVWLFLFSIFTSLKSATSYGPAVAAAGYLYAVVAGLFGWVSRPAKPSSESVASPRV